jgi:hypothetical protein
VSYEIQVQRTADRLRQLSSERLAPRAEDFYALLMTMTDRCVPRVAVHGWADQLVVIGGDAPSARREALVDELIAFRRSFDLVP